MFSPRSKMRGFFSAHVRKNDKVPRLSIAIITSPASGQCRESDRFSRVVIFAG